jgi:hypothetical protein
MEQESFGCTQNQKKLQANSLLRAVDEKIFLAFISIRIILLLKPQNVISAYSISL